MFDARAAKALGAGEHITIKGAPGLRLVATSSRRTWTYRYRVAGDKLRQVSLGHWPTMGFPAALAAWQRLRDHRNAGGDPAAEKKAARRNQRLGAEGGRYTVGRACSEFLAAYESTVAPRTYLEAKRLLERDALSIADQPANAVSRAQAFKLIDGMRDRPVVAVALRRLSGAVWDRSLDAGKLVPELPNWWCLILRGKLPSRGKRRIGCGAPSGSALAERTSCQDFTAMSPAVGGWCSRVCVLGRDWSGCAAHGPPCKAG